jgi:hypothetical protein
MLLGSHPNGFNGDQVPAARIQTHPFRTVRASLQSWGTLERRADACQPKLLSTIRGTLPYSQAWSPLKCAVYYDSRPPGVVLQSINLLYRSAALPDN